MGLKSAEAVGVIGLGAIGLGVAKSLLRAGITTHGCDLNADAVAEFKTAGGIAQVTPAEMGRQTRIIFLFVVNAAQARAVLFGEGGLTQGNSAAIVVCCVTMAPADVIAINIELQSLGFSLVDAPTSGGVANAAAGKTKFMVSGAPDDVDAVSFALDAVADTVFRIGDEVGQGSGVKTVHQLLAGVHIAAAMEALALGIKMGIDPQTLYDVVTGCAGNSWMFENRVPHVLDDDYTPLSAVDIFVKDLGLVLDTGLRQRFPLPLAAAAHQQFLAASAAGYGREDDAAVIKVYRDLTNLELPSKKA